MPINAPQLNCDPPAGMASWLYVDEITHRTLNDYAAMLSLLRRASRMMPDAEGVSVLNAVADRIQASATACNALRPSREVSVVNLDDELERLCSALTTSILRDRSIRLTLRPERVRVSAQRSWQISLIVSELIMNAAKHAFSPAGGTIIVDVALHGAEVLCAVADSGQADTGCAPGRGSGIVDALAADLGGAIFRQFSANGSTVALRAPLG